VDTKKKSVFFSCDDRIHRSAMWVLGEYCTTRDDIQSVMTLIRQSLGEVVARRVS